MCVLLCGTTAGLYIRNRSSMEGGPTHICHITIPSSCLSTTGSHFALDIGGSLAKLAYVPRDQKRTNDKEAIMTLVSFDTECLDEFLTYIKKEVIGVNNHVCRHVRATGVSCLKYREKISEELNVQLHVDSQEMYYMTRGIDLLWRHLPPDRLFHEGSEVRDYTFGCPLANAGILPCLLVNLGSAMTIVKIGEDGVTSGVIGSSTQGGLTFLGLGALLTSAKTYSELIQLAERGDRHNVDLLVKDTAGSHYNVSPDNMVSSFGKAAKLGVKNPNAQFKEEDIAHSLLYSITEQLAHTAYLTAKAEGIDRAIFCGSFISANAAIIEQINSKLAHCELYLKHQLSPVFLRYEGYLGAIGALFDGRITFDSDEVTSQAAGERKRAKNKRLKNPKQPKQVDCSGPT